MISWAVRQRIGVLHVGDPRGVLNIPAGRRHNLRQWQVGRLLQVLTDKATLAGITVRLVDERGISSTCPACQRRVPKPRRRTLSCPHCRIFRAPPPGRGRQHRHPCSGRRTHHPDSCRAAAGGHAPSSRPTPTRCRPVP
ncbi:hypothetical protein DKL51_12450, partial [Micromonospora globispora]